MNPVLHLVAGLWLAASPAWSGLFPPTGATEHMAATRPDGRRDDAPASLLGLSDDELQRRIESDPGSLGSLSIGKPGSAVLFNGVSLPAAANYQTTRTAETWATTETIEAIQVAVDTVCALFPETPTIMIGDISGQFGGRLKRHESHQGGRDVDFGFYYNGGSGTFFVPGTAGNLDLPRNWALVRALVVRTDVEMILLDRRIQKLLYDYALKIGEERPFLDRVFQFPRGSRDAIVKHLSGHRNHYHVRFYSPVAQELGRRAQPMLVQLGLMNPPTVSVRHLVRRGETIGHLATRYGVSSDAIQRANGLRSPQLRAGRSYRIPVRRALPAFEPVVVPRRPMPSVTPECLTAVDWPTPEALYGEPPLQH